jgi:hypothetical protein
MVNMNATIINRVRKIGQVCWSDNETCNWTMPSSNLCWNIDYPAWVFRALPLFLQDNVGKALQIRPRPLPHPFHPTIRPYTYSFEIVTALLYKLQMNK